MDNDVALNEVALETKCKACADLEKRNGELTEKLEKLRTRMITLQDGSEKSYKQRFIAQEALLESMNADAVRQNNELRAKDMEIERVRVLNVNAQENVLQQKMVVATCRSL